MDTESIQFYEVSSSYIDYLVPHAPYLFHNKKASQKHERKYIGIILHINDVDYFAPLSSFKEKHLTMKETLDFIKIKDYAVINLNSMFPVPPNCYTTVNISLENDEKYRSLLLAEYRCIKSIQTKIRKNAFTLYRLKLSGTASPLTERCNDFSKLEELCNQYECL